MPRVTMRTIPEPAEGTRSVLAGSAMPKLSGEGDTDFACGKCGAVLMKKMNRGQVNNAVLRCTCGTFNESDPPYLDS